MYISGVGSLPFSAHTPLGPQNHIVAELFKGSIVNFQNKPLDLVESSDLIRSRCPNDVNQFLLFGSIKIHVFLLYSWCLRRELYLILHTFEA